MSSENTQHSQCFTGKLVVFIKVQFSYSTTNEKEKSFTAHYARANCSVVGDKKY